MRISVWTRHGAAALACIAALGTASAAEAQYTYSKIMYPGSTWTEASGVNDSGQVVGTYTDTAGTAHGFLFHNGTYTTVDHPDRAHNYLFGINDQGKMVGSHSVVQPRGPYHASLLENGVWVAYDFPGHETDGRAINAWDHIVGIYNAGFGTPDHGFLKIGDSYTSIDYPGAAITYVFGINDAGTITGTYRDPFGRLKGFMYVAGVYTSIAYPGATETFVGGVNNAGAVVGWKMEGGRVGGFVQSGGGYRPVIVPFANAANTKARAISDVGVIVGTYTSPECQAGCSFIATPSPTTPAMCDQTIGLRYNGGVLDNLFTLKTTVATTWTSWLIVQNTPYRLWSLPLPVIQPSASVTVPIQLPPIGPVVLASFLSTPTQGTICADFTTLDTGTGVQQP